MAALQPPPLAVPLSLWPAFSLSEVVHLPLARVDDRSRSSSDAWSHRGSSCSSSGCAASASGSAPVSSPSASCVSAAFRPRLDRRAQPWRHLHSRSVPLRAPPPSDSRWPSRRSWSPSSRPRRRAQRPPPSTLPRSAATPSKLPLRLPATAPPPPSSCRPASRPSYARLHLHPAAATKSPPPTTA
jgi:hypothetical protein